MRAVVQRVAHAEVLVAGATTARIGPGLLALVGLSAADTDADIAYLAEKLLGLRVFEDDAGKMNLDVTTIGGQLLLVPNFTLYGDCRKGRRPSFSEAAPSALAQEMFGQLVSELRQRGARVQTGPFGALMQVHLVNDGPVTLLLDSRRLF